MTPAALTPTPSPRGGEGEGEADPAAELLRFLRAAGFRVSAEGGKVFVQPRADLSPAECGQVVKLKPGLLLLLAAEAAAEEERRRWVRCQNCLDWVDPTLAGELPFGSCQPKCPYRRKPR